MVKRAGVVITVIGFLHLAVWGCSGSEENVGPASPGTEGSPCPRSGGGCKSGLVCVSNVCVLSENDSGGSSTPDSSGAADASNGSDTDTGASDAPFDASVCKFLHPLVDGGDRFCSAEHCYCASKDSCYAKSIASGCCGGAAVVCSR